MIIISDDLDQCIRRANRACNTSGSDLLSAAEQPELRQARDRRPPSKFVASDGGSGDEGGVQQYSYDCVFIIL